MPPPGVPAPPAAAVFPVMPLVVAICVSWAAAVSAGGAIPWPPWALGALTVSNNCATCCAALTGGVRLDDTMRLMPRYDMPKTTTAARTAATKRVEFQSHMGTTSARIRGT